VPIWNTEKRQQIFRMKSKNLSGSSPVSGLMALNRKKS